MRDLEKEYFFFEGDDLNNIEEITGKEFKDIDEDDIIDYAEQRTDLSNKDVHDVEVNYEDMEVTFLYYEKYDEDDIPRGWNEEYLNSIGMSMRDFY